MCAQLNEIEKERFAAYKLHMNGKSNSFIARKFKKSIRWVQKNTKRANETGKFEESHTSRSNPVSEVGSRKARSESSKIFSYIPNATGRDMKSFYYPGNTSTGKNVSP